MRTYVYRSNRQLPSSISGVWASLTSLVITTTILMVLATMISLHAQQVDTAKPYEQVNNWPPSGFIINPGLGLNTPLRIANLPAIDYWLYIHQYGGNAAGCTEIRDVDALHNSPYRDPVNDRFGLGAGRRNDRFKAGFGREVQFYPFDSVQSPDLPCAFAIRNGGNMTTNLTALLDRWKGRLFQETFYDSSNASTAQPILASPVYYYDSLKQIYPMERFYGDDSALNASQLLNEDDDHGGDLKFFSRTYYFVTTAHLFANPPHPALLSDSILKLEVWHEVPKGFKYFDSAFNPITATADTSFLCDTFYITKAELKAGSAPLGDYRIISRGSDLRTRRIDGQPGPLDSIAMALGGGSLRLNVKVYWTGKEKVAIQNIAIRDSVGELVIGDRPEGQSFREGIIDDLWRKVYGTYVRSVSPDSMRREIIGFEVGREADDVPTEYAGYAEMNRILKDTFNLAAWKTLHGLPILPGDSIGAEQVNKGHRASTDYLLRLPTVSSEVSFTDYRDTSRQFTDSSHMTKLIFETPYHTIPTFKQHNG
ncbi:MAG: hypothetical protein ABI876_11200, partial [Bacteroidota bacterium]